MAISNSCVWEVRSTGNDANGGGFVTGASGTDFSQQDAAQFALTGVTSAGAGSTFLDASAAASMIGNICRVVSGTNFTIGLYQIISVVAGVSVTVDRAITTGVGSAGVINIGGAFATIQTGMSAITVDTQICYVRAATYAITSSLTSVSVTSVDFHAAVIGYGTVRGDNAQVTVTVSSAINGVTLSHSGWKIHNFIFNDLGSGLIGASITAAYCGLFNCQFNDFNTGVSITGVDGILGRVLCTGSSTAGFAIGGPNVSLIACVASGNASIGFSITAVGVTVQSCASLNNTGASSDGFNFTNFAFECINCLAYNNGRDGFRFALNYSLSLGSIFINCISAKNVGFGVNQLIAAATIKNTPATQNNGFWSNGSGATNNYVSPSTDVQITGTDPTNDPFVSKATGNFALNSTAGAGALLRAVGFIGTLAGVASIGYEDIGTFQHQDSGGAAGIIRNPEL